MSHTHIHAELRTLKRNKTTPIPKPMNDKEKVIMQVLQFVVEETTNNISEFTKITAEDILGKTKKENATMARCIFVSQLRFMGYACTTIASVINREEKAIPDILFSAHEFKKRSWAYRIAEAKVTLRVSEIFAKYKSETHVASPTEAMEHKLLPQGEKASGCSE